MKYNKNVKNSINKNLLIKKFWKKSHNGIINENKHDLFHAYFH